MSIAPGTQVNILRGANGGKTGVVQQGTWPNTYGNYGVDIHQPNGGTLGYWIAANDLAAIQQPAVVQQPAVQQPVQAPAQAPAQSDWTQVKDPKSGRMYWHNKTTRQSSWTRPAGV